MVRLKNRYLLVNILYPTSPKPSSTTPPSTLVTLHQPTPPNLKAQDLLRSIKRTVTSLFGDYGSGAIAESLAIKYFSPATSTFIVRVSRKDYRIVWAALTFMDRVVAECGGRLGGAEKEKERLCVFRVVRISGTMKKAEAEAVRRARDMILRVRKEEQGSGDGSNVLERILGGGGGDRKGLERGGDFMVVDGSHSGHDDFSDDG